MALSLFGWRKTPTKAIVSAASMPPPDGILTEIFIIWKMV
jgi:hypothetical protein